jgi:beta-glucanase (GH16 family)
MDRFGVEQRNAFSLFNSHFVLIGAAILLCLWQPARLRAADAGPALRIDVSAARHKISPYIYGINFAEEALAKELRLPVRRWGGNSTTRYNWKINMANRASDWYFENLPEVNDNPSSQPQVSAVNAFIDQNVRTATDSIITVPLIGWTPKDRGRNCGFSIAKYGLQQANDWQWWSDCGSGTKPDGTTKITGNDPHDTSQEIDPNFVQDWIRFLISLYGVASQGGVKFYDLDNEPMLWMSTHRDVHPQPTTYDEVRDRTYSYAAAIKQVDPAAQTLGPVLWGWNAYFYSALDTAADQWWNKPKPDQIAHGGTPFLDWFLQQMSSHEKANGVRILDYLDLHFYPQGTGVSGSNPGDSNLQALRLRSTRGLWDPTYVDESWIANAVRLIPRMRDWVANNYPGTKLAITEYNWGALRSMNGALAQADVLGIFGREGLDLATLWGPDASDQPWAHAFRMYRNYDGSGGSFGDVSVQASSDDQDRLAIYAARRSSDSALTMVVINKTGTDLSSTVTVGGFVPAATAKVYRYSAANLSGIVPQPDQSLAGAAFSATFPASSITLLVAPAAAAPISAVFAHVALGGGFATTITLTNTGGDTANGTLLLTDQASQPLAATITSSQGGGSSIGSTYPISLPAGGSLVLTAARSDAMDVKSGWARIESAGGTLAGVATFQWVDGGRLKSVAGVLSGQPVDSAVIPVDNDGPDRLTGFAVANPGSSDVHLTVTVLREDGLVVDRIVKDELNPLAAGRQVARFLNEYNPAWTKFRGSMQVTAQAGEKFAVVALVQNQGQYTAVPIAGQKPTWRLVWSDEFDGPDGSGVDPTKWVPETGGNGWGNNELEYYTNRLDNAYIEKGSLVIKANQEAYANSSYTSARLKTQGKFTQKYGRFEARIKLPQGQGIWPAFWMLGDNIDQAGWPTCGEIDIMENIGKEPSIVHGTIHGPGYSGGNGLGAPYLLPSGGKFADDYHLFSFEWDPDAIRWYVDGSLYETRTPSDAAGKTWVFDHPFFIILNVAVGGNWPLNPDATTVFPQKMLVDYVRVYERVP